MRKMGGKEGGRERGTEGGNRFRVEILQRGHGE